MQKRHNLYRLCRFYIYTNLLLYLYQSAFIFKPIYLYKYDASLLAIKCIFACCQMNLCLLSNESMLAVKDVLLLSKT